MRWLYYVKNGSGITFTVDKDYLEGDDTTLRIHFYNTNRPAVNLKNYQWRVNIEEIGGAGSMLSYTYAENRKQRQATINETLTNFIQANTLGNDKKAGFDLFLNIEPGLAVVDLLITLAIYDTGNESVVQRQNVRWADPATDFTINNLDITGLNQLIGDQPSNFQIQNKEVKRIKPEDITLKLETLGSEIGKATFTFMDHKSEAVGDQGSLKDLLGHNHAIKPSHLRTQLPSN